MKSDSNVTLLDLNFDDDIKFKEEYSISFGERFQKIVESYKTPNNVTITDVTSISILILVNLKFDLIIFQYLIS